MILNELGNLEAGFIEIDREGRLVFSFSKYLGKLRLDIRFFFLTPDNRWYPSKTGVCIWEDEWVKFLPIIEKINKEIKIYLDEKKVGK